MIDASSSAGSRAKCQRTCDDLPVLWQRLRRPTSALVWCPTGSRLRPDRRGAVRTLPRPPQVRGRAAVDLDARAPAREAGALGCSVIPLWALPLVRLLVMGGAVGETFLPAGGWLVWLARIRPGGALAAAGHPCRSVGKVVGHRDRGRVTGPNRGHPTARHVLRRLRDLAPGAAEDPRGQASVAQRLEVRCSDPHWRLNRERLRGTQAGPELPAPGGRISTPTLFCSLS